MKLPSKEVLLAAALVSLVALGGGYSAFRWGDSPSPSGHMQSSREPLNTQQGGTSNEDSYRTKFDWQLGEVCSNLVGSEVVPRPGSGTSDLSGRTPDRVPDISQTPSHYWNCGGESRVMFADDGIQLTWDPILVGQQDETEESYARQILSVSRGFGEVLQVAGHTVFFNLVNPEDLPEMREVNGPLYSSVMALDKAHGRAWIILAAPGVPREDVLDLTSSVLSADLMPADPKLAQG